jgi:soluble lytic murein transglycosylase-like protein
MDVLSLFAGCGLFIATPCSAPSAHHTSVTQWQPLVSEASAAFALPQAWVSAVMARESGGRLMLNGRPITSKAGAMGLMQVMPKTYADLRQKYALGADPQAPRDNILAGTAYLRQMYVRYGYPGMFAAYNAGPGRFDAFLAGRKALPDETLAYLAAVAPGSEMRFSSRQTTPVKLEKSRPHDTIFAPQPQPGALFVRLSNSGL